MKGYSLFEVLFVMAFVALISRQAINSFIPASGIFARQISSEISYCVLHAQLKKQSSYISFEERFISTCKGRVALPKRLQVISAVVKSISGSLVSSGTIMLLMSVQPLAPVTITS